MNNQKIISIQDNTLLFIDSDMTKSYINLSKCDLVSFQIDELRNRKDNEESEKDITKSNLSNNKYKIVCHYSMNNQEDIVTIANADNIEEAKKYINKLNKSIVRSKKHNINYRLILQAIFYGFITFLIAGTALEISNNNKTTITPTQLENINELSNMIQQNKEIAQKAITDNKKTAENYKPKNIDVDAPVGSKNAPKLPENTQQEQVPNQQNKANAIGSVIYNGSDPYVGQILQGLK